MFEHANLWLTVIAIVGAASLAIGCLAGWYWHHKSSSTDRRIAAYHRRYYLFRSGTDDDSGREYSIASFDGGRSWYAVSISNLNNVAGRDFRIFGPAEDIYPGLLVKIDGMEQLRTYVIAHGSTNPHDPRDRALLKSAGVKAQIS